MKIKQGGGWAFEGLGKEFRSHEVLPPSNVKVKFRSQSEIHLPDIGAASLYTHKKQIPHVFGRAVQLVYEGSDVHKWTARNHSQTLILLKQHFEAATRLQLLRVKKISPLRFVPKPTSSCVAFFGQL